MLLYPAVQRGLFRSMALMVDRGAIGRPLELPADGLHDGLPRWQARTFVRCALHLNRLQCRVPVCALRGGASLEERSTDATGSFAAATTGGQAIGWSASISALRDGAH